jgi:DNA-binding PucR family transcriptional regulator
MMHNIKQAGNNFITLSTLVDNMSKDEKEKICQECNFVNYAKIFEDNDMMNTIDCLFENNLNVSRTARNLYMHRNTLIYRLNKLKRITGLSVCNFADAITFIVVHTLYCAQKA